MKTMFECEYGSEKLNISLDSDNDLLIGMENTSRSLNVYLKPEQAKKLAKNIKKLLKQVEETN